MWELLLGLLGGGDAPGSASQEAGQQTQGGLASMIQGMGGIPTPVAPQSGTQGGGQQMDMGALMSLFKPKKPLVPPTAPNQGFDTPKDPSFFQGWV